MEIRPENIFYKFEVDIGKIAPIRHFVQRATSYLMWDAANYVVHKKLRKQGQSTFLGMQEVHELKGMKIICWVAFKPLMPVGSNYDAWSHVYSSMSRDSIIII